MKLLSSTFVSLSLFVFGASAHTYVWSVWVNGVDQGSGVGIREPAYNGPPLAGNNPFGQGSGFANGPVRDINSIDMRCNVLGDIPDPTTIQVKPGDVVTFEWHHETRTAGDDIIDGSHKGAGLVYISPNPPTSNSWVKIQEEGESSAGQWYVTGKHTQRKGKQDVQIPSGLAPGQYLLRPELLTLHEAEVSHLANSNRGLQFYISCIQVQVTGSGATTLPAGVDFPGAYKYSDPGIVHNVYYSTPGAGLYQIPGPTVWAGAAPSPSPPAYGTTKGYTVAGRWNTWIGNGFSTATAATSLTIVTGGSTIKTAYSPSWPTTYVTPPVPTTTTTTTSTPVTTVPTTTPTTTTTTTTTTPTPTPTAGTVAKYGQCGGIGYTGPTACVSGTTCNKLNDYYFQCL